ncbi:transposase, IS605 OrfB family, central region [Thermoanaerobacter thermohydrosulfuricus]|uniref:Transposase, IS605 OrfB family, central region n=1 Tax=Thermoanaerobacter thermohydrosulfuricus TaxID=1516 RepID=A0A1G7NYT7_THETY|nr:RNA-guided endonuclease TnpB family protein [Thermoanaerobacter thermohydrosulfuricus]SDF79154.1 transposase, IS605 OrfB family, central region [Thermoanaerobacter thermohydrosulfuricus]
MSKVTKSVFLYGEPTQAKREKIEEMKYLYTDLINTYIELLVKDKNLYLPIFLNNSKDSQIRQFEKNNRKQNGLNKLGSALGQNAIDHAVKELHNHFIRIRNYMYSLYFNKGDISNFVSSITLLNASICDLDPQKELLKNIEKITNILNDIENKTIKEKYQKQLEYYNELLNMLKTHTKQEIEEMKSIIRMTFFEELTARKLPYIKEAPIQLDTRLCEIEKAQNIKADYVIRVKTLERGKWIEIPLTTSKNSKRRLNQYKNGSPTIKILKNGLIKVAIPITKKTHTYEYKEIIGVDAGETDLIHTSENKVYGSFKYLSEKYDKTVIPKLANRSKLRALMKKYKKELKSETNEQRKEKLRRKINNINKMLQGRKTLNRVLKSYNHAVQMEIARAVKEFINDIKNEKVLIVMEDLNILEFDRGKKRNRYDSNWAKGKLLQKLQETLDWDGKKHKEVEPAYTSQECPICHNVDKKNRNGKHFKCTYCGYESDADYVAALNIKARAEDKEIEEIVEEYRYNKKERHKAIKELIKNRHREYLDSVAQAQARAI